MFTGIIETTAKVTSHTTNADIVQLTLQRPSSWDLAIGQSIAVDGVCLTVTSFNDSQFTVELMPETLQKTTFGHKLPKVVNLERAMPASARFEGHIVQGHVDRTVMIKSVAQEPKWRTIQVSFPPDDAKLLVPKGSIAINGVSLTVVDVADDWFSVSLIPHTLDNTTLGLLGKGDKVNIEYDIIGKYISKGQIARLDR